MTDCEGWQQAGINPACPTSTQRGKFPLNIRCDYKMVYDQNNVLSLLNDRDEAKAAGHKFFLGLPCDYGHGDKRYASDKSCAECRRMQSTGEAPEGGWKKKRPNGEPTTLAYLYENCVENAETGCLEWQRALNAEGYGVVRHEERTCLVHRVSFELAGGIIPRGHGVLHRCDNPKCLRPSHLFSGTQAQNMLDMAQKGRCARGQNVGGAILTEQQVPEVDVLLAAGVSQAVIAAKFGVSRPTVAHIKARRNWKHVPSTATAPKVTA